MADDLKRIAYGVLGDIHPDPSALDHMGGDAGSGETTDEDTDGMEGGSQQGESKHAGSRHLTDATTVGGETGGTRNYRTGTGAVGSDIGNRPE